MQKKRSGNQKKRKQNKKARKARNRLLTSSVEINNLHHQRFIQSRQKKMSNILLNPAELAPLQAKHLKRSTDLLRQKNRDNEIFLVSTRPDGPKISGYEE